MKTKSQIPNPKSQDGLYYRERVRALKGGTQYTFAAKLFGASFAKGFGWIKHTLLNPDEAELEQQRKCCGLL